MTPPLPLSVIIPAYNSRATIEECLRAVRSSSYAEYELIVVDDGSTDGTGEAAALWADRVIRSEENRGPIWARFRGAQEASGLIHVCVDSDVRIGSDTLGRIAAVFAGRPDVDALTGRLSKDSPHRDFFSSYKNLYMHYIFGLLPERVTFLYGSIQAVRASILSDEELSFRLAEDTELGQRLHRAGRRIVFAREIEVVHLKRYTWKSFFVNDFMVPFQWAGIFLRYGGWRQLGRGGTGFAHAPRRQLASLAAAALAAVLAAAPASGPQPRAAASVLVLAWLALNAGFARFLRQNRGAFFALVGLCVTFADHLTMAAGASCGFLRHLAVRTGRR